jgi:hypothetical protein
MLEPRAKNQETAEYKYTNEYKGADGVRAFFCVVGGLGGTLLLPAAA